MRVQESKRVKKKARQERDRGKRELERQERGTRERDGERE